MLLTVAAAALAAGLLIGLTGIGGVLLVPVLTEVAGVPLDRAISASLLGFLVAGSYAAFVHLRRARVDLQPVAVLCVTSAVGALAGAASLDSLSAVVVRLFIALLCLASGANALLSKPTIRTTELSIAWLGVLGVLVGYASAISGTGGPVTLIPLLLALGMPIGVAIALGLAAQVPIALSATAVYAFEGRIDLALGATLSGLLLAGTIAGAKLSARIAGRRLTTTVALTLVAVGILYGYATVVGRGG